MRFQSDLARIIQQVIGSRNLSSSKSYASESKEPLTLVAENNGIRTITLNNKKKRNALSMEMLDCLHNDISQDADDETLRVIILRSNSHVFSSGHDLKELATETHRGQHSQIFEKCTKVMKLVQDITVPVIAEVNGVATAAGCQLVASCDIAVAGESSTFSTPGVNIGLFCSTPAVALARAVPRKLALEMLFTGRPISAQEALLHGLVSKIVPDDQVGSETLKIAERICETSRIVTALGKATFYSQINFSRDQAYRQAEAVMVSNLALKDGKEGIRAFLEKRKPVWTHGTETES